MKAVYIVCFFTLMIHMFESLALAMRLAGVRTRQIATSISFVNASFLIARLSNMFQAPILGAMVDQAIIIASPLILVERFRLVIFSAFVGNVAGAFFMPTAVKLFERGILHFEKHASLPKVIFYALQPRTLIKIIKSFTFPSLRMLKGIDIKRIPKTFLVLNVLMVSIYAIGVLSSLYAGAMVPSLRATAVQLSGIVNGIATIMLALMVDPSGAHITDQAVHGKRSINDVRTMMFYMVFGRIAGTLIISQLIFIPASFYIMVVAKWVNGFF